jgi:hypothetical protein
MAKTQSLLKTNKKDNDDVIVDDPIARAKALVAGAQMAAEQLAQRHAPAVPAATDSGDPVVLSSPRPDDCDMSTLGAARRLAAAARAAAQAMTEAANSVGGSRNKKTTTGTGTGGMGTGTGTGTEGKQTTTAADSTAPSNAAMHPTSVSSTAQMSRPPTEAKRMYNGVRGKSGTMATIVRVDGSAQARWPGSNLAISIDREVSAEGNVGWRTFVAKSSNGNHNMSLSLDPNGYGSINRVRTGKTLVSFNGLKSGGTLLSREGMVLKRWNAKGQVTLADGTPTTLGADGKETITIKLEEKSKLVAKLTISENDAAPIHLVIEFKCRKIQQTFRHGHNSMPV